MEATATPFTTYAISNTEIFNRLSHVDMRGRSIEERAQGYVTVANEATCHDHLTNITRAAYTYMGITLVRG